MKSIRRLVGRSSLLVTALAFGTAVVLPAILPAQQVGALQLSSRKLTMASTADGDTTTDANNTAVAAGAPGNGAQTSHTFTYTMGTNAGTVNSIALQYCTTPLFGTDCIAPTGMSAVGVNGTVTGYNTTTSFAIDATTTANTGYFAGTNACSGTGALRQNCVLFSRPTTVAYTGTPTITINVGSAGGWIKNPTANGSFYVRIMTFTDNAYGNGNKLDEGAVAGSVNEQIDIIARVQEKLNFSVAAVHSGAGGGACTPLTGTGEKNLGDSQGVLSHLQPYFTNTYFRLSTNASNGTVVQYSGDTLKTAGEAYSIDAVSAGSGTAAASNFGNEQFGLTIGSDDTGFHSFTDLSPVGSYVDPNNYAFALSSLTTPVTIAQRTAGNIVNCDTGSVKYVGNIATTTNAGMYKTRITYFATPTF